LDIVLEKETYLNEVENNNKELTKDEKINFLREKSKSYISFKINNL